MSQVRSIRLIGAAALFTLVVLPPRTAQAQESYPAPNAGPNPYQTINGWAKLPDGRKWGSTAGVDIAPDGSLWAYDRCGANSCADSPLDPILHFDANGNVVKAFGKGLFMQPHGIHVDPAGNVWVTDAQGKGTKGFQVFKFSPDGRVLLTLGKAGVQGEGPDTFGSPTDVAVSPNGDIYVADGHVGCNCPNARIVKFDRTGKFIKAWGKTGKGPGEFDGPHTLAFDSRGRLIVGDRTNNRVQLFDQDGKFIAAWTQFGRPSGVFVTKDDTLFVADSESREEDGYGHNPGVHRGIRYGSLKDGKVAGYVPDPEPKGGSSAAEGVAVDPQGNVYGAEVGPRDLKRYTKK